MGNGEEKSAGGQPIVVVADDDVEILSLVTRQVRSLGYQVLEASDGEDALNIVKRVRPDLVILDVMMPGRTGWEVCRAIRDEDSLKSTRVLMLTGIGEHLNELTAPLYGADGHLDKPFDLHELLEKVKSLLGARRA